MINFRMDSLFSKLIRNIGELLQGGLQVIDDFLGQNLDIRSGVFRRGADAIDDRFDQLAKRKVLPAPAGRRVLW